LHVRILLASTRGITTPHGTAISPEVGFVAEPILQRRPISTPNREGHQKTSDEKNRTKAIQ
jgi:hypothetical protein